MLPKYRRIFAKVRDFLTRLGNALRGLGFHSVESIFAKVESGEVGRRTARGQRKARRGMLLRRAFLMRSDVRAALLSYWRWLGYPKCPDSFLLHRLTATVRRTA